jgi:hypothetical protein
VGEWADYVFDEKYSLRSLYELQHFISSNRHLPGVPSAKEIMDKGINIAEMDKKLLEKIEELTLYILQQQKQIESQQKQIDAILQSKNRQ